MSRVYHDASITYAQLQQLIEDTKRDYTDAPDLEPYEFGRELERGFKIDYGAEVKAEIDGLPWFAANHLSLNYGRIVRTGFGALIVDLEARAQADPENEYYTAALLVARAASGLVARYAGRVRAEMANADARRQAELQEIAEMLDHLAAEPAHSFREGVQLMWLLHIMASFLWSSALSFGRFDQYMNELYEADLAAGRITRAEAEELLCCLWLKINEPCLRTVQSMTLGGVMPEGEDAVNPLTWLCLDVVEEMKLPYPNVGVRINVKNPPELLRRVTKSIAAGASQAMVMTDALWIANLKKLGYADRYANDYYNMGCVEIMIPGKLQNWGVTEPIAFPMLYDKVFARIRSGELHPETFEAFEEAYLDALREEVSADYQEALNKIADKPCRCFDPFGYALNVKINPDLVHSAQGLDALHTLLLTYVENGGPQVQFNFVDAETLKRAKREPQNYRNLIVRIGGYCEYFVNLDGALQDEIITRTVHEL